jgi:hypothetical protein
MACPWHNRVQTMLRGIALACAALFAVSGPVDAQHRLDLSIDDQKTDSAFLGHPSEGFGITAVSGQEPTRLPVELRLVSISSADLTFGDAVVFEVELKNIGKAPIDIPWSSKSPVQFRPYPDDVRLSLIVTVSDATGKQDIVSSVALHGSPYRSSSLLTVQPGETAAIRARGILHSGSQIVLESTPQSAELRVDVWIQKPGQWTERIFAPEVVPVRLSTRPVPRPGIAGAQHRLDLTTEPATASDGSKEGFAVGMGSRGMSGQRPIRLPLELSIVSLTPTDLVPGNRLTYEVSIRNVGKDAIDLPWSIRRSHASAVTPDQQQLYLSVMVPDDSGAPQTLVGTVLYGSQFEGSSMLALQPNETASIRADGLIRSPESISLTVEPREVGVAVALRISHAGVPSEQIVSESLKGQLRVHPVPRPSSFIESKP